MAGSRLAERCSERSVQYFRAVEAPTGILRCIRCAAGVGRPAPHPRLRQALCPPRLTTADGPRARIRGAAGPDGRQYSRSRDTLSRKEECALSRLDQWSWAMKRRSLSLVVPRSKATLDNRELLTGDCLILVCFALYKQIAAIVLHPAFPGWLAPLKFNPVRFEELASFAATLVASWVISSLLVGGYQSSATADLPTALARVSLAWLVSMPVAACQLVILTAAEDRALVGDHLFASSLPLAASGPGEPLATAAGVLGLMALWRCFYTVFLDFFNSRQWSGLGASVDRYQDMRLFADALRAVFLLSIACIAVIQFLAKTLGEDATAGAQTALSALFQQ